MNESMLKEINTLKKNMNEILIAQNKYFEDKSKEDSEKIAELEEQAKITNNLISDMTEMILE